MAIEKVLHERHNGGLAERGATVAGTGERLKPDRHILRLQRGRQFFALSIRDQRVVSSMQDQHWRSVFADVMNQSLSGAGRHPRMSGNCELGRGLRTREKNATEGGAERIEKPAPDARAAPPEAHESLIGRKTGEEVPLTGLSFG